MCKHAPGNSTRAAFIVAASLLSTTTVAPATDAPVWDPEFGQSAALNNWVRRMIVFDPGSGPKLYIGGGFGEVQGTRVSEIAVWNGQTWAPMESELDFNVAAFCEFDDGTGPRLYVSGGNQVVQWTGAAWDLVEAPGPMGHGDMLSFDDGSGAALYVATSFEHRLFGAHHVVRWDGRAWSPVGGGMLTQPATDVDHLASFDDGSGRGPSLYVAGDFGPINGVNANNVARWTGDDWAALGTGIVGVNDQVLAMAVHDDGWGRQLYVGGSFSLAGGRPANRIARWDGSNWSSVGDVVVGHSISAMCVHDDGTGPALYAAGGFQQLEGTTPGARSIARWDGRAWTIIGVVSESTFGNDSIKTMTSFDDGSGGGPALYAGGDFSGIGGTSSPFIARWGYSPCARADINNDGVVDVEDLVRTVLAWGLMFDPLVLDSADTNLDGIVDVTDLNNVIQNWSCRP